MYSIVVWGIRLQKAFKREDISMQLRMLIMLIAEKRNAESGTSIGIHVEHVAKKIVILCKTDTWIV